MALPTLTTAAEPLSAVSRPVDCACRGCGFFPLESLFDLGNVPSVNSFPTAEELPHERPYLLEVCVCPRCFLVQLSTLIPPADLFTEYRYLSQASQTQVRYLEELAAMLSERLGATKDTKVLEVGSNDGTLLAAFLSRTQNVLGVDPAKNLVPEAAARGVPMVADFLTESVAAEIERDRGRFDLILGLNVVAHTPDLLGLLRSVRQVLKPRGTFVMEAAHVLKTILRGEYDTVYHEHVFCFSLTALRSQFARAGLAIVDVEESSMQGGSLRVYGSPAAESPPVASSVARLLRVEAEAGVRNLATYQRVGERVRQHIDELRRRVQDLKNRHGRVWALGASARGVVILNAAKLDTSLVEAVVDDTPLKQGRLVPGVHIPVVFWDAFRAAPTPPTAYLLTSWNYEREVMGKLRRYVDTGELLVPFPELRVNTIVSESVRAPAASSPATP